MTRNRLHKLRHRAGVTALIVGTPIAIALLSREDIRYSTHGLLTILGYLLSCCLAVYVVAGVIIVSLEHWDD